MSIERRKHSVRFKVKVAMEAIKAEDPRALRLVSDSSIGGRISARHHAVGRYSFESKENL